MAITVIVIVASGPVVVVALWGLLNWRREVKSFVRSGWDKLKSRGFLKTYFGFGVTSRVTLLLMFLLGLVVLAFLWTTDQGIDVKIGSFDLKRPKWLQPFNEQWLHTHAYIPNILAGFTGFLIGAPVAVVFLASFTVEREERVALERVNTLSLLAWYSFRNAVFAFCNRERIEALRKDVPRVQQMHGEVTQIFRDIMETYWSPAQATVVASGQLEAQFDTAKLKLDPMRALVNGLIPTLGDSGTVELEWSAVVSAWNTLEQYVRLQRLERDLRWFDLGIDVRIRRWSSRPVNPLQEFTDVHGSVVTSEFSQATMVDSVATLTRWAHSDRTYRYTISGIGPYKARHRAAQDFLNRLLNDVDLVELSGWPESESKPTQDSTGLEQSGMQWRGAFRETEGVVQRIADADHARSLIRRSR
jgi:hypothetical protein